MQYRRLSDGAIINGRRDGAIVIPREPGPGSGYERYTPPPPTPPTPEEIAAAERPRKEAENEFLMLMAAEKLTERTFAAFGAHMNAAMSEPGVPPQLKRFGNIVLAYLHLLKEKYGIDPVADLPDSLHQL